MPLFNEDTDTSEFDTFMQNVPRDSLRVCGKTYRCRASATGDTYWSSAEATDGDAARGSRDCNVDMLVAAAHANNCNVSRQHKSIPSACLRENPILTAPDGTAVQVRDTATHAMPTVVEAHWRCAARGAVNEDTHDPSHVEDHGGLALLRLAPEVGGGAANTANTAAPDDGGAFGTGVNAPRDWTACTVSSKEQRRACSADTDCPFTTDKLNDMLLTKVRELNVDMSGGLSAFWTSLRGKLDPNLAWTPARAEALKEFSKTEAGVKASVRTLMAEDATFRDSVRTMIETDPDFSTLRESARRGSCGAGKCAVATVLPTTRLYDGGNDVSFSLLDGRVMYARNGVVREAEAVKCTADLRRECGMVADVVEGGDSLSLAGKPLASAYRLKFAGVAEEYMVMNNVSVRNAADCAARVCEHNASACPSSACALTDDGVCVPK